MLWQSLHLYWKDQWEYLSTRAGASIWAAVLAYAAVGIFNDSTVSVAPVFWGLLGLGMALNQSFVSPGVVSEGVSAVTAPASSGQVA